MDMLGILHKTSSDDLPMFGVFDLTRLPPLDLNSVDITSMTQDIKKIRNDINKSQSSDCSAKVLEMGEDIVAMKTAINQINTQMKELLKSVTEKEVGLSKSDNFSATPSNLKLPPVISRVTSGSTRKLPSVPLVYDLDGPGARPKELPTLSRTGIPLQHSESEHLDYSRAIKQPPKLTLPITEKVRETSDKYSNWKDKTKTNSPPFIKVVNKRQRPNYIVGKGLGNSNGISGKGRFISLFVSRLEPDIEANRVKKYVDDKFEVDFICEKMQTRYDTYASFKLEGYCKNSDVFFKEENWPENILVRRFYKPRKPQTSVIDG